MKTNFLKGWKSAFALCSTILLLGCLDQANRTTATAQTVPEPSGAPVVTTNETEIEPPPAQAIIPPANLSPGLAEVVKLAQSGVSEQVLLAYVEKSNQPFNPSVDEIVYLKDIGVSDAVVAAMVRHAENTNAVAQAASNAVPSAQESLTAQADTNGPSLIDPNAPSYSVSAETNYATAPLVPSQPQEVNINYFESALSPYGNWIDVADYGRCWQPTVVILNRNWRPYADRGRWVYTSSGWYWQSDYSWGWAPFHYGRWYCDNRAGWVWVPGQTWGPAWVSWRYTDQYCGWAPLPPSARYHDGFGFYYHNSRVGISFDFGLRDDYYTFIPTSRFCDRTPSRFYVSGSHGKTIYRNSVVINNYNRGNNNTIINEGVGRDRIARATHTPIRTVSLRELPADTKPVGRAERLEGNSLTVFRPDVTAPVNRTVTQRSLAQKAPLTQHSGTLNRSVRGNAQVESSTAKPAATTTQPAAVQPKQPTTVRRSLPSRSIVQGSPKSEENKSPAPSNPVVQPARPDANSSETSRILHNRPTLTERSIRRDSPKIEINRQPQAPATPNPIARETPVTRPQTVAPSVVPQQRVQQPTAREIRRETPVQNNFRTEQRAAIAPRPAPFAPAPVAPAPVQRVSPAPVQRIAPTREVGRPAPVERSIPAPTRTLTPSMREFTPRATPSAPAQRSMERSVRSERGRS